MNHDPGQYQENPATSTFVMALLSGHRLGPGPLFGDVPYLRTGGHGVVRDRANCLVHEVVPFCTDAAADSRLQMAGPHAAKETEGIAYAER
jgi:hypothetical protein